MDELAEIIIDVEAGAINQPPIEHRGSFDSERVRKSVMLAAAVVPVEDAIFRVVADTRHDGANQRKSSHVREALVGNVDLHRRPKNLVPARFEVGEILVEQPGIVVRARRKWMIRIDVTN